MGDLTPEEHAEFNYIEVSKTTHREIPPQMIKLQDLPKWIEENGPEDIYSSVYRYSVDDPNVGSVLGALCFDLDCKENPEKARKEAVALAADLKSRFQIPEANIAILFTGHKGFRLIVNRRAFDFEPSPHLPLIHKSMAAELVEALKLKTVDFKIYNRRALLRLENSRHPRTGLYQVRLTFEELQKLKMDDIRRLAIKPRPIRITVENKVSPKAREFYLKHRKLVEEDLKAKKEVFTLGEVTVLPDMVPCVVKRFEVGAEEGIRNISVFQLSVYWTKQGKNLEEVKNLALQFNQRCRPPLDEKEVLRTVESAFKGAVEGRYNVGCSSEAFYEHCPGKHLCPLFKRELAETMFPPEIKAEAEKWLSSSDLEDKVKATLDLDIVGEDVNKMLAFYLLLSGKRRSAKDKQIVILQGESGGGKSTQANMLTQFFRTKKRARFSEHALDYSDLESFEVLYLQELVSGQTRDKETAVSTIRFLSADDSGYEVEVTVRDPETGRFKTETFRIPPITVISTTTDLDLDRQFERRCWFINVDESPEQTARILEFKDEKEDRELEIDLGLRELDKSREILKCALNMLEDGKVAIPFKNSLRKIMDTSLLRSRGDYDKIKTLIRMRAWLYQRQRPFLISKTSEKIWIALPEDGLKALQLAEKAMRRWRTRLDERVAKILPRLIEISQEEGLTTTVVARKLRVTQSTARKWLNHLVDKGVMVKSKGEGRGAPRIYDFLASSETIKNKLMTSGFKVNLEDIISDFEKETEMWLTRFLKLQNMGMDLKIFEKFFTALRQKRNFVNRVKVESSFSLQKGQMTSRFELNREDEYLFYRRIPPAEKCGKCGKLSVEYEIKDRKRGTVLRLCEACFKNMQLTGFKLTPVPENEEEFLREGRDEKIAADLKPIETGCAACERLEQCFICPYDGRPYCRNCYQLLWGEDPSVD